MPALRSFAPLERFIATLGTKELKPAYVLIGGEIFLRDRCRKAILEHLLGPGGTEFGLYDLDLAETNLFEVLDRARTPSLMAPFQVFFVRNVKNLYGRGSHDREFNAMEEYCRDPNSNALIVFVADHIDIPADLRRMDLQAKERYQRIQETLGGYCGMVELARADEADCAAWLEDRCAELQIEVERDAARELVDALGANMLMIASELEKLILYASERKRITLGDVETMVLAAKQRSLYELTDAISRKDRSRSLQVLDGLLNASEGEEAAIGHVYMLARTYRQMLVILENNVRDSRAIWQVLWPGFRVPPFAVENVIQQARRYKSRRELMSGLQRIARADLELRSSPVEKRMVLERLVMDLATEQKPGSIPPREYAPV